MNENLKTINWYPGHMKKTRELIKENLKAVDLVVEIIDSRIPVSSRNPIIDELVLGKQRIILLNKSDLANPKETTRWQQKFEADGNLVMQMNSQLGDNIKGFYKLLDGIQTERNVARQMNRPLRMMIVGVPNVGKSSFINRLAGKKSARTGDKPGVTKGKQWITLDNGMQLLDTPGILWPKFEDPIGGLHLAFCGSIKDEILDTQDLAYELIRTLLEDYSEFLAARYKLVESIAADGGESDDSDEADGCFDEGFGDNQALQVMEEIAVRRGFLLPGKRIDYERVGRTVLDEFRSGTIGRITLEKA